MPPLARRLLLSPWVWAVVALGAAVVTGRSGPAVDLVPFLFSLLGGWFAAIGFVGVTLRMRRPQAGVATHAVGAVVAALLLWVLVSQAPAVARELAGFPRSALLVAQFAVLPAAAWVWIALLGRAVSAIRPRASAAPLAPPAWEHEGGASVLRFPAVRLRMRVLRLLVAMAIVVVGTAVVLLLVSTGDLAERLGPRILIAVIGVLLVLPVHLALRALLRRRTVTCTVSFGARRVVVDAGGTRLDVPLARIDRLHWRTDGQSSRLELHAGTDRISLIAGLARAPRATAPGLPALPRRVRAALADAGLTESASAPGTLAFRRPDPS
ncbi:hypothetical protein ACEXQB_016415 [Herbiconiux sp. P18]|uniref:hypothetical protein n=1 Tax=Herbiconiux liangxiaofengii TaxID=3342795 RepID=UPI0035BB8F43